MALIETYPELARSTRAAKDMVANIKVTRQQAKIATEPWQNTKKQRVDLEQQLLSISPFYRTSNVD